MSKDKSSNGYGKYIKKTFSKKVNKSTWKDDLTSLTENEKPVDIKTCDIVEEIKSKCSRTANELDGSLRTRYTEVGSGSVVNNNSYVSQLALSLGKQSDNKDIVDIRKSTTSLKENHMFPHSTSELQCNNGARPKTKLASTFPQQTRQEKLHRTNSLIVIEEETKDKDGIDEETLAIFDNDQTSDYDTLHRDDISSIDECRTHLTTARAFSSSVPDLRSKGKYEEDLKDLRPLQKNYVINVKRSKNVLITPDKGTATLNKTTITNKPDSSHLSVLKSVRETKPRVETELFNGAIKYLNRTNNLPLVIFKGSGYGCTFAAKMLFERVTNNDDTKAYFMKTPDEMNHIGHEEKTVILVIGVNGPTGSDMGRLNAWYELLQERMPVGTLKRGNLTFIMTMKDSHLPIDADHPLMQKYSENILDAAKKQYRPSSTTKDKLVAAFMAQRNLRANPVKGGSPIPVYKDGTLRLIDKDIVDGIVPLLGSVRCVGKLADFFKSDLSEGLISLQKPVPYVVQRIRKSYKEGGKLFLTLLAVHAHGGQLGVGRLNQMRKLNQQTEKFWYSTDNIDKMSKGECKKNEKSFSCPELKHLYKFAKENNHLFNLGNNLQKYASRLDGDFLSENNDVYRFCDGRVYYSFLLVYCEMFPDALEHCEDHFFYNFVHSCRDSFEDDKDVFLNVDDRKLNFKTRAVMKRIKKEMMLRHVAKCMNHPIMSTAFFQLFLEYLEQTKHLLWMVLKQQDCDPKEPYSCLYHGLTKEEDTLKAIPRNITEVILSHDIWKIKRKKQRWKKWIKSQEKECLIHAAEMSNCQTFVFMVEKGAEIPIAALKRAIDVGAEEIIDFINNNGAFSSHDWCEAAQHAAETVSKLEPSPSLFQVLMSLIIKSDANIGVEDIPPLIHHAVQTNNISLLNKLVEGDIGCTVIDINKLYKGKSALTAAVRLGFGDIVAILLDKKANFSQEDIFNASTEGHNEILKLLLHSNPTMVLAEDSTGLIPIFYAVSHGRIEAVKTLISMSLDFPKQSTCERASADSCQLQMGVTTNQPVLLSCMRQKTNREGQTVLHTAAEKGHKQIIQLLIAHEFEVNVKDCNDETPLSLACKGRHMQSLRVVLNAWNLKGNKQDESIVMRAVQNGDIELTELLTEYGFGINFVSRQFGVPLHVAIQYGMHDMARFLLSKGADPEIAQDGHRPVHITAGKGDIESLKMLKEFGANTLEVTGVKRQNIIHFATEKKHTHFIETVFQMTDTLSLIDMKDANGETALHIAAKEGCPVLTSLLLKTGFNPKLPNRSGSIPESLAELGLQRSINSKNVKKWNAFADCVKKLQSYPGK